MRALLRSGLVVAAVVGHGLVGIATDQQLGLLKISVVGDDGAGIVGAIVTLRPATGRSNATELETGPDGSCTFADLIAGAYRISAKKDGYLGGELGQRAPVLDGEPAYVTLADGPPLTALGATLKLWRSGVIAGRVTSSRGEPRSNVTVGLYRKEFVAGRLKYLRVGNASVRTNDLGEYRLFQLSPAEYLVFAERPGANAPMFYPGLDDAETASSVTVSSGGVLTGIDIAIVESQVSSKSHVSGQIDGSNGRIFAVEVFPEVDAMSDRPLHRVLGVADGRFVIDGIAVRDYRFRASSIPDALGSQRELDRGASLGASASFMPPPLPRDPALYGEAHVQLRRANEAVAISVAQGAKLRGKVVFESSSGARPNSLSRQLPLAVADGSSLGQLPLARVEADGSFETMGLPPGKYLFGLAYPGFHLSRVQVGDRTQSADFVEVGSQTVDNIALVFTDRASGVAGHVSGVRALSGVSVLAFPKDPTQWVEFGSRPTRLVHGHANTDGSFSLNVPPGDYWLLATISDLPYSWRQSAFLSQVSANATEVRVPDGAVVSRDLKVIAIR